MVRSLADRTFQLRREAATNRAASMQEKADGLELAVDEATVAQLEILLAFTRERAAAGSCTDELFRCA